MRNRFIQSRLVVRRQDSMGEKKLTWKKKIVSETMRPLAPIRELPDIALEDLSDAEVELETKQLELSGLSLLNIFNWSRRSRLQEEIRGLKKKITGEKIAKALGKE